MSISSKTRRWLGLIAIALGVALIVVDTTIVKVIVPSIIDDMNVNSAQAQWIQETFFTTLSTTLKTTLSNQNIPPQQTDGLTHAIPDSAGAAIESLAAPPRTHFAADAAREAMTHSVSLVGNIAAAIIVLGLVTTAFIRTQPQHPTQTSDTPQSG